MRGAFGENGKADDSDQPKQGWRNPRSEETIDNHCVENRVW